MGISIRRYLPAMGTAGLERCWVSGKSRLPRPPPRMTARIESSDGINTLLMNNKRCFMRLLWPQVPFFSLLLHLLNKWGYVVFLRGLPSAAQKHYVPFY